MSKKKYYSTTITQRSIFFLDKLAESESAYVMRFAVDVCGSLDTNVIKQCFENLIDNFQILRATFEFNGEKVQYCIREKIYSPIVIAAKSEGEAEMIFQDLLKEKMMVTDENLFRVYIIDTANRGQIIYVLAHHIIVDGWSVQLLLKYFVERYTLIANGERNSRIGFENSFEEYVTEMNKYLISCDANIDILYWKNRLEGYKNILALPYIVPKMPKQYNEGGVYSFKNKIDKGKLQYICKECKVTPFYIFITVYYIVLTVFTKQNNIKIGVPILGRDMKYINSIGLFVNTIVLQNTIELELTFQEIIERVRNTVTRDMMHQKMPFEMLVDKLNPVRNLGTNPIFQVLFNYIDNVDMVDLFGCRLKKKRIYSNESQFDLSLIISMDEYYYDCEFQYLKEILDETLIRSIGDLYIHILNSVINNHKIKIIEVLHKNASKKNITETCESIVTLFKENIICLKEKDKELLDAIRQITYYPGNMAIKLDIQNAKLCLYVADILYEKGYNITLCETGDHSVLISDKQRFEQLNFKQFFIDGQPLYIYIKSPEVVKRRFDIISKNVSERYLNYLYDVIGEIDVGYLEYINDNMKLLFALFIKRICKRVVFSKSVLKREKGNTVLFVCSPKRLMELTDFNNNFMHKVILCDEEIDCLSIEKLKFNNAVFMEYDAKQSNSLIIKKKYETGTYYGYYRKILKKSQYVMIKIEDEIGLVPFGCIGNVSCRFNTLAEFQSSFWLGRYLNKEEIEIVSYVGNDLLKTGYYLNRDILLAALITILQTKDFSYRIKEKEGKFYIILQLSHDFSEEYIAEKLQKILPTYYLPEKVFVEKKLIQ